MWDANESLGKLAMGGASVNYDLYFRSAGGRGGRGGPGGGPNLLFTRFIANPTFKALYEQKLQEIYPKIHLSGAAVDTVDRYSALIHAANAERSLVDLTSYDQAVQKTADFLKQRMAYLATTDLLGAQTSAAVP